jgi:hypothetical protein
MKIVNYTLISLLTVSLIGCKKDGKVNESGKDSLTAKKDSVVIPEVHKEYYGIYTGDFAGMEKFTDESDGSEFDANVYKRISLKINRITKDSVYGQSIVNGNQRPIRGIFNESSKSFVLDEPGNDKTDGRFEVKLNGDSLTGKWNAFNKSAVKSPLKTLKLTKKEFVYNPNFMLDKDSNLVDWSNPKDFVEKYTDADTGKTESYYFQKQGGFRCGFQTECLQAKTDGERS